MLRLILGLVAGVIASGFTVFMVEGISHMIWPPPEGTDISDPEQLAAIMHTIPLPAKIAVLVAWAIGVFVGGAVSLFITKKAWAPWVVAAFVFAMAVITLFMIPHPMWMVVALPVATALPAWLASRIFASKAA